MTLTISPTNYYPTKQPVIIPTLSPFLNSTDIPIIIPTNNPIYPDIVIRHYTFYRSPPLMNISLSELLECKVVKIQYTLLPFI